MFKLKTLRGLRANLVISGVLFFCQVSDTLRAGSAGDSRKVISKYSIKKDSVLRDPASPQLMS